MSIDVQIMIILLKLKLNEKIQTKQTNLKLKIRSRKKTKNKYDNLCTVQRQTEAKKQISAFPSVIWLREIWYCFR